MGNELFSSYSIDKNNYLLGGHMKLWKIFKAIHKERKNQVRVFVFDKKDLENYPQNERESLLSLLRKEASNLMKFKHPNILSIIEPLAEDKYSIGFITENFNYSLSSWVKDYNPSKLECKLIINDLLKTIGFLHNNCHVIHTNLNPDTIFINDDNRIKISGMNFYYDVSSNFNENETDKFTNNNKYDLINYYSSVLNQNLNYIAPEIILKSEINLTSDIFSIGALIYFLLSDNNTELLSLNSNIVENYKKIISKDNSNYIYDTVNEVDENIFEKDDKEIILKCIEKNENERIDVKEVLELGWFTDYKLKALCFIENLPTNDIVKNYDFLKKLPQLLKMFEFKLIKNRFLNALLASLRIESLINPIIPAIFAICEIENIDLDFEEIVWPKFKELFQMKTIPTACLYFILSKMTFIGSRISHEEFSKYCIPFVCKAMDCGVSKIQGVIVDNLNFLSNNIDNNMFFNQIYPRIIQILLHTKSTTLKVRLLNSIKNLYGLLDQNMINNNLCNDLEKLRKIDQSGNTSAGIILIYEEIIDIVTIESIRKKIFPTLLAILTESNISKNTYERVTNLIEVFMKRIKSSREKDLTDNDDFEVELLDSKESENRIKKIIANEDNKEFLINFFNVNSPDASSITSPEATKNNCGSTVSSEFNSNSDVFDMLKKENLMDNLMCGGNNSSKDVKKNHVTFNKNDNINANKDGNDNSNNEYKEAKSLVIKTNNDKKKNTDKKNNDDKFNNSMNKIVRQDKSNNVFDALLNDFENDDIEKDKKDDDSKSMKIQRLTSKNKKNQFNILKNTKKNADQPSQNTKNNNNNIINNKKEDAYAQETIEDFINNLTKEDNCNNNECNKDKKKVKIIEKEKEIKNNNTNVLSNKKKNLISKSTNELCKQSNKHNGWDNCSDEEEKDDEDIFENFDIKINKDNKNNQNNNDSNNKEIIKNKNSNYENNNNVVKEQNKCNSFNKNESNSNEKDNKINKEDNKKKKINTKNDSKVNFIEDENEESNEMNLESLLNF